MICKFLTVSFLLLAGCLYGQGPTSVRSYTNFEKYDSSNQVLKMKNPAQRRVVFMGNSITESWPLMRPDFFVENGYIGRGISGQVTHQMLLRFRRDVVALKPKVVVILAGINDIAQNSGYVPIVDIAENIKSMAELADNNGIKVILCSVLPAIDFPWNPGLAPAPQVIDLNNLIRSYAEEKGFLYADYYNMMVDESGGLKVPEYTSQNDLVHPNEYGYQVMEGVINPIIKQALAN